MFCANCRSNLSCSHMLEDHDVPGMSNRSRMIHPRCSVCGHFIGVPDVAGGIGADKKVLLISGTAGAGKTALGQLIESRADYVFVDGDAVQKRVHYYARRNPTIAIDADACQRETIETALILLGLGYNVVVGYVIGEKTLVRYQRELRRYGITPTFRVLVPERDVCLQRDIDRDCWTAGEKWVDAWYDEMRAFLKVDESVCIDSSNESLEETFERFVGLL